MNNCGFDEETAKSIEANYHELYKESDDWQQNKLHQCSQDGYIDVAFGLRIRTPLLAKSLLDSSKVTYEALNEARSVANAFSGQSYGLLTNRAINEFMERVWKSEYRYSIMPISLIHDAIYLMVENDIDTVKWVNDNLIECMAWQELGEIKHEQVKLEAQLDIYYPTWADTITLPNNISAKEILNVCSN